jgi:hypothetical protein
MTNYKFKTGNQLSPRSILIWRIVQTLVWLIGITIIFLLIFLPTLGRHLFWDVLITIAPALLVVSTGLWRNICPLASMALFPSHMGFSKRKKLTQKQSGILNLIAVIALFIIAPLRHAIFDANEMATAILLISVGAVALILGSIFEWKSIWCSGLCPVYPVEKLYGFNNRVSLPNAHCDECHKCVVPCPDSTPDINPLSSKKTAYHKMAGRLMIGAFPGFVWGWFQEPAYTGAVGINELIAIYQAPVMGLLVTSAIYFLLRRMMKKRTLITIFAATAVSCYYWFRLPALFGFGLFPGGGMLVDLKGIVPEWYSTVLVIATSLFFFWWMVFRKKNKQSWVIRPSYASDIKEPNTAAA